MCHSAEIDFSRVKVYALVAYGPTEGDAKEKERFWNGLDSFVDRVGNG